ncbi:DNA-binding transcriptional LysR family regulator [Silvibacterium bohemicum]|uniref:DNA-binding transcriptional LysR family regulator n=1 Tax=Silvibacterium bohemicum TaxID=1577686 RepID=A0A841JT51_9BACT|nr:LysR family transcriptional regulator [Silvibacterium bohemicum]MBB6144506.1 DNA-binding transcriptional LysR family regulator [Silvibacterium bohemicum]
MIENRHLRYFSVLARTLHMTRAAEKLYLAQPALSQNIQQLEEELGTILIQRTGRKLSLTAAGQVFLHEAENSLRQFELAKLAAQRAGRGELGHISVGFNSTAGIQLIPEIVKTFRTRYPDVDIRMREMGMDAQLAALRSGEIDVAITYALPDEEFCTRQLPPEPLLIALNSHHPMADREVISLGELTDDVLIVPARYVAATLSNAILALCENAGFTPRYIQEITTWPSALGLVAFGYGVLLIPATASILARPGVVMRRLTDAHSEVGLLLLWKRGDISSVVERFLALF